MSCSWYSIQELCHHFFWHFDGPVDAWIHWVAFSAFGGLLGLIIPGAGGHGSGGAALDDGWTRLSIPCRLMTPHNSDLNVLCTSIAADVTFLEAFLSSGCSTCIADLAVRSLLLWRADSIWKRAQLTSASLSIMVCFRRRYSRGEPLEERLVSFERLVFVHSNDHRDFEEA